MSDISLNRESHYTIFWQFIETYLPNYYSRDDVLWDDILNRYLYGEEVCERDMKWIEEEYNCDKELILSELISLETRFAEEALEVLFEVKTSKRKTI
ncbi:MAG: 6-phospho-beta-glucosidase [Bacteroidales bacterium]|nr:6-phospho-beta-glucosidase [Bacteroidales bacterium]